MNAEIFPVPPEKTIVLDTETTGLNPFDKDEILQLSIIDGNGKVLFSDYIKPAHRRKWDDAMQVHGITPAMVRDKRKFSEVKDEVKAIFDRTDLVIGYNLSFDLEFLKAEGIEPTENALVFDVMHEFAPVNGKWSSYHGNYTWAKLEVCAKRYGFKFDAHDALEDAKATLHCYKSMLSDNEEYGYLDYRKTVAEGGQEAWRAKLTRKGRPKNWFKNYEPGRSAFQDEIEALYQSGASYIEVNSRISEIEAYSHPVYDEIDDEIYRCFIDGGGCCYAETLTEEELKLPERIQDRLYEDRTTSISEAIAEICDENGGRLYKSKAKAAKWAIIRNTSCWTISRVEDLRNQGYKVTNLPNAIRFFGLEDKWNCENQIARYEEHRKWERKRIENEKAGIDTSSLEYVIDFSELRSRVEKGEKRQSSQAMQQPIAQPTLVQQSVKQKNTAASIAFKVLAVVTMILLGLPMLAVEPIAGVVITVIAVMIWKFGNRYKR